MSEIVTGAVAALNDKLAGQGFDGTAKMVIEGEGSVMIDETGAREGDGEADVTLTATAETFTAILAGDDDATAAFMTGRLAVDGDMGKAIALAGVLA